MRLCHHIRDVIFTTLFCQSQKMHYLFANPETDNRLNLVESDRPGLAKWAAHHFGVAPNLRAPATQSHVMETEPPRYSVCFPFQIHSRQRSVSTCIVILLRVNGYREWMSIRCRSLSGVAGRAKMSAEIDPVRRSGVLIGVWQENSACAYAHRTTMCMHQNAHSATMQAFTSTNAGRVRTNGMLVLPVSAKSSRLILSARNGQY